jgi:superfamily I DNA/RNA helicase
MARLINEADLRDQLPDVQEPDLFDIYYPQLALDALDRLGRLGEIDALVIDEGQDLLKPPYVQFLDALLSGELENGCWRLFYDPNQDLFAGRAPSELDRVETLATCYRLTKNCRNTREIALTTSILSGVRVAETLTAEGPDVVEAWGSDRAGLERGFRRLLHKWLQKGVEPEQIVVLSPRTLERSLVSTVDQSRLPRRIVDIDDTTASIHFSTIAGFKGLESDAVVLVDIDELSSPERIAQLYTGASRAKSLLGIVLDESCRDVYTERVRDLVDRILHTAPDPS